MPFPPSPRFTEALRLFDEANAADPRVQTDENGDTVPKELLYARRMSAVLERFNSDASEALRLAARAQHIRRWTIPRADYPMDRKGYLRWRETLKRYHAEFASGLLRDAGYDGATIDRVAALLRKENLKTDAETQTLEDVACLVFIEFELAAFAPTQDTDKLKAIVVKTWTKMSERGRAASGEALARLPEKLHRLTADAVAAARD